jgi:hypothetical protein
MGVYGLKVPRLVRILDGSHYHKLESLGLDEFQRFLTRRIYNNDTEQTTPGPCALRVVAFLSPADVMHTLAVCGKSSR